MAYADLATLAFDRDFLMRTAAAAAAEPAPLDPADPVTWAEHHRWDMAAAPGFADAYATAILNGVERPGNDPAVITDPQILAAVQSLTAA